MMGKEKKNRRNLGRFKQRTPEGKTSYCSISSNTGLDSSQQVTDASYLQKQDLFRCLQVGHHFERNIRGNLNESGKCAQDHGEYYQVFHYSKDETFTEWYTRIWSLMVTV